MNTRTSLLLVLALSAGLYWGQKGNKEAENKIIQTEKQLWEAWKNNNPEPFKQNLAANAIAVSSEGLREGLEPVTQDIMGGKCQVSSYSLEETKVTWVDQNTALLTYKGNQDATCDGKKIPSGLWATSMYVKRGNNWKAMFHQETPMMAAMQSRE